MNKPNPVPDIQTDLQWDSTSLLGQGSFGSVYKAFGTSEQSYFAVKRICVEQFITKLNYNPGRSKTFEQNPISSLRKEVDILRELNNDHVVKYLFSWFDGPDKNDLEQLCHVESISSKEINILLNKILNASSTQEINFFNIKMEYCSSDLKKWMMQGNSDLKMCHEIFKKMLLGLNYIHSKGVIHRDLKPDNIFLNFDNVGNITGLKIGDFGFSCKLICDQESSLSVGVGCAHYQSPEVKGLSADYSEKVDIFSAGLVFYEMLYPFQGAVQRNRYFDILRNEAKSRLSKNSRFVTDFPQNFEMECDLIDKMTKYDEKDRPSALKAYMIIETNDAIKSQANKEVQQRPPNFTLVDELSFLLWEISPDLENVNFGGPGVNLTLDVDWSEAPDLEKLGIKVKQDVEEIYSRITSYLDYQGHSSPSRISLKFENFDGIGTSSQDKMTVSAEYCRRYPNNIGYFVGLAVLSIEKYNTSPKPPWWWIDGLCNYFRRFWYENGSQVRKPRIHESYQENRDSAAYLINFINTKYCNQNPDLIQRTHRDARMGRFRDALVITQTTGKSIDQLWLEMLNEDMR